jgi:hypothetical protein
MLPWTELAYGAIGQSRGLTSLSSSHREAKLLASFARSDYIQSIM